VGREVVRSRHSIKSLSRSLALGMMFGARAIELSSSRALMACAKDCDKCAEEIAGRWERLLDVLRGGEGRLIYTQRLEGVTPKMNTPAK